MKAVTLLINDLLPEDVREDDYTFDKKSVDRLSARLAAKHPEKYASIIQRITDIGRNYSYHHGMTLSLKDMRPVIDMPAQLKAMDAEVRDARIYGKTKKDINDKTNAIYYKYSDAIEKETMINALATGNNLGNTVVSGARGKPPQLKGMISTPGLYTDFKDNPIPLFVRHSFAEGLRPAEYVASTFGARRSVIEGKKCLHESTEIALVNGQVKQIKDIEIGDVIFGSDIDGNTKPVAVVQKFNQGLQHVYKWSFRLGNSSEIRTMISTEDHKCLISSKFYHNKLNALTYKKKQKIDEQVLSNSYHKRYITNIGANHTKMHIVQNNGCIINNGFIFEKYALLLGLLCGDGCLTKKSVIKFNCADTSLVSNISGYLDGLNLKINKSSKFENHYRISTKNYNPLLNNNIIKGIAVFVANGASLPIYKKLQEEGYHGKYAYEKLLPKNIWSWDIASISYFIAGLFATEDCISSSIQKLTDGNQVSFSFCSTSFGLVFELRRLLELRLGIYTSVVSADTKRLNQNRKGFISKQICYTLSIHSIDSITKLYALLAGKIPGVQGPRFTEKFKVVNIKQKNPYPKAKLIDKEDLGLQQCYDIMVDNDDHLFSLNNGFIVSNSTANAGDLGKLLAQAASSIVVTEKDCGVENGIDLTITDESLKGRVLSRDVGKLKAGTILDKDALQTLSKEGIQKVIARSALTCNAKNGICQKCLGADPRGAFKPIGFAAGLTAANSIGEPLAQSSLNAKHTSGIAKTKKTFAGFNVISQIVQTPEAFPNEAALSTVDGRVTRIEDAPQGGKLVFVNNDEHYIPQGFDVYVKPGQVVEAGDQLADGIVDSAKIVQYKGLGEGRRFYSERLKEALDDSGIQTNKKHTEVLARSAVNQAEIDDYDEGDKINMPGDIVNYNNYIQHYVTPDDSSEDDVESTNGKYLQKAALHYTIGTKLTPKKIENLKSNGYDKVVTSKTKPNFIPTMLRLRNAPQVSDSWLQRMSSSYIKTNLVDSAMRGLESNTKDSPYPSDTLAKGVHFAKDIETTGQF